MPYDDDYPAPGSVQVVHTVEDSSDSDSDVKVLDNNRAEPGPTNHAAMRPPVQRPAAPTRPAPAVTRAPMQRPAGPASTNQLVIGPPIGRPAMPARPNQSGMQAQNQQRPEAARRNVSIEPMPNRARSEREESEESDEGPERDDIADDEAEARRIHEEKLRTLDEVKITPEHLRANGTMHTTPYAAIAEVIDNAVDSEAKNVRIFYTESQGACGNYIEVRDDGKGMNRHEVLKVILMGYSEKRGDSASIGQFGNGLKSGAFRIGDTMLLCSRHRNDASITVLLVSLRFMEQTTHYKCFAPCITYDLRGRIKWRPLNFENDDVHKHENALKIILDFSPFKTEEELKKHLSESLPAGGGGTSVIIGNLKRLASNDKWEELYPSKDDIVAELGDGFEDPNIVPEERTKKKQKEAENDKEMAERKKKEKVTLSKYLSQLYIEPKVAIYIGKRKVNLVDPIRTLAEPRSTHLDKTGLEHLISRKTERLREELAKNAYKMREIKETLKELEDRQGQFHQEPAKLKELIRESNMIKYQMDTVNNQYQALQMEINTRQKDEKAVTVTMGIDLVNRDPRAVFYTNGRRICTHYLCKIGKKGTFDLSQMMGVVCIVNLPYTMLPTAQNREKYESPTEFNAIVKKLPRCAKQYFRYADPKFKSGVTWKTLGYEPSVIFTDKSLLEEEINAYKEGEGLMQLRKQCANCRLFENVTPTEEELERRRAIFLDPEGEPFRCSRWQGNNEPCLPRANYPPIPEFEEEGNGTMYGVDKALPYTTKENQETSRAQSSRDEASRAREQERSRREELADQRAINAAIVQHAQRGQSRAGSVASSIRGAVQPARNRDDRTASRQPPPSSRSSSVYRSPSPLPPRPRTQGQSGSKRRAASDDSSEERDDDDDEDFTPSARKRTRENYAAKVARKKKREERRRARQDEDEEDEEEVIDLSGDDEPRDRDNSSASPAEDNSADELDTMDAEDLRRMIRTMRKGEEKHERKEKEMKKHLRQLGKLAKNCKNSKMTEELARSLAPMNDSDEPEKILAKIAQKGG